MQETDAGAGETDGTRDHRPARGDSGVAGAPVASPLAPPDTARARFLDRLRIRPILADGAMGTLLFSRGVPQRACLDELVLTRPELIGTIHREYLEAGADLVETATFGANRVRLAAYGLGELAGRMNRRGAQIAREARDVAGRDALVAGSVGPLGAPLRGPLATRPEPRDGREAALTRSAFLEQVEGLLEGGVDLFVLETFTELDQLLVAIEAVRSACDLPIVAEMTFGEELATTDGTTPEAAVAALAAAGADVVGVNCGVGPVACLEALQRMRPGGRGGPLRSIMPNAGLPQRIEGRFVYAASPRYMGEATPRLVEAGARIVGGCCGTTPDHIAAMRLALDALADSARLSGGDGPAATGSAARGPAPSAASGAAPSAATPAIQPPPTAGDSPRAVPAETGDLEDDGPRSRLGERLRSGAFVVSVEIDPPRSIRIERTLDAARLLATSGVDLVNISDSAMARVRMSGLAVAYAIQAQLGLETLIHVTTRDRNLMALESELLGAHALGIRNVLALTGDPPRIGDYPTGTGVWDVDSIGLIEIMGRLNRGEDRAGTPIGAPARFTIACALDPTALDARTEWDRLERKLEAGADVIMTQPLYGLAQVEAMLEEARRRFGPAGFPLPVLLGVLPLHSSRHAEFLHHEVPGITIPEDVRKAMADAGERGTEIGLELALSFLAQVGTAVSGIYVMPSFGRYEQAAELVRRIRATMRASADTTPLVV